MPRFLHTGNDVWLNVERLVAITAEPIYELGEADVGPPQIVGWGVFTYDGDRPRQLWARHGDQWQAQRAAAQLVADVERATGGAPR